VGKCILSQLYCWCNITTFQCPTLYLSFNLFNMWIGTSTIKTLLVFLLLDYCTHMRCLQIGLTTDTENSELKRLAQAWSLYHCILFINRWIDWVMRGSSPDVANINICSWSLVRCIQMYRAPCGNILGAKCLPELLRPGIYWILRHTTKSKPFVCCKLVRAFWLVSTILLVHLYTYSHIWGQCRKSFLVRWGSVFHGWMCMGTT